MNFKCSPFVRILFKEAFPYAGKVTSSQREMQMLGNRYNEEWKLYLKREKAREVLACQLNRKFALLGQPLGAWVVDNFSR